MENVTNNEMVFWNARKTDPRAESYLPLVSDLTDATLSDLLQHGYDLRADENLNPKNLSSETKLQVICSASRVMNSYWQNLTRREIEIGHLRYNNSWFGYDNRYGICC